MQTHANLYICCPVTYEHIIPIHKVEATYRKLELDPGRAQIPQPPCVWNAAGWSLLQPLYFSLNAEITRAEGMAEEKTWDDGKEADRATRGVPKIMTFWWARAELIKSKYHS